MTVTMSHHCGSHSSVGGATATMKHSFNKNFRAKEEHISPDLSDRNIVLHQEDLRKAYEAEFGQAVKNYNQSQVDKGHPERQIDDYLKKIGEDKQKNVLYEHIIQFGDRNSVGVNGSSSNHIKAMKDFVKGWDDRNPNMHLVGAVIHRDEKEGTDHLHLMYFPVARDMERGLEVQNGYKQALKQMGFETKAKERTAQMQWERSEKQELERLGREHGLEIEHKHGNREHFQKDVYKAFAEKEVAEKELESTRNSLQDNKHALDYIKKDLAETREEIEQIKGTVREMPQMPQPDGKGFHRGYYTPDYVKHICNAYRSDWLEERQKANTQKERADKAEQTLKAYGDVKPHELHNPEFLRDRAREIDKQYQQADRQIEEQEHGHTRTRARDEIEIGGR